MEGRALASAFLDWNATEGIKQAISRLIVALANWPDEAWIGCAHALLETHMPGAAALLLDHAVRTRPRNRQILYIFANSRRLLGDIDGAERVFREVVYEMPDDEPPVLSLAHMLLEAGRYGSAGDVVINYFGVAVLTAENTLRAAQFLLSCRRNADALTVCSKAISESVADYRIYQFAGRMLMSLGRFAEARERFSMSRRLNSRESGTLILLSSCQRYNTKEHPDLVLFEDIWNAKPGIFAEQELAGFALGKALDDLGEFESAARVYSEANWLVHTQISSWNSTQWRTSIRQLVSARIGKPKSPSAVQATPIFIIGLPRTGTTLLADHLGRNQGVSNRGELNWLPFLHNSTVDRAGNHNEAAVKLVSETYFKFLFQDDPIVPWYIDKNPLNFRYLKLINAAFPFAKIIHCVRDIRDTALSLWTQRFSHPENDYSYSFPGIAEYVEGYRELLTNLTPQITLPMLEVKYEDLIASPVATINKVTAFVGCETTEDPGEASVQPVATASVWQVRQKIYNRSVGRWLNYDPYLDELRLFSDKD